MNDGRQEDTSSGDEVGQPAASQTEPRARHGGVGTDHRAEGPDKVDPLADEVIPFSRIRRVIAQRMVESKVISPHTLMAKEIDYENVEAVRRERGARFRIEEGFGLSYLPFCACATVEALASFPFLNASVINDSLIVHRRVNLGIAVDLDKGGLVVPVVDDAQGLKLRSMPLRIRQVATKARAGQLRMEDLSDGTFTITNAGPMGTSMTGAIINQPEVAILATDSVGRRPVVVTSNEGIESIAIHSTGMITMNFDHRAVDGAYVARFLSLVSEILGERSWANEL